MRINQRETAHDGTFDGVAWESLGVYDLSDPTLRIEITTNNADGYIIADAVRWATVPEVTEAPSVLDDMDTAYAETTATQWHNVESGYQGNSRSHDATNSVDDKADWTFEEMEAGKYQLFVTYTAGGYAASNAEYSIYDGATLVNTVRINQRQAAHDGTFDGVDWESLGVYDLSDTTLRVELTTNNADGYIVADGVRWEAVGEVTEAPTLIDDVDVAYADSSPTTQWQNFEAGYLGNSRYHEGTDTVDDKADWTFEAMDEGRYDIFVTYEPGGYAASNAEYSVYDGATLLKTIRINQRETPHDGLFNTVGWESLGVYDLSDPTLHVELTTNDADGYIIADAVRWEAVPDVTEAPTIVDDVDTAYAEATSTQWHNLESGYQGNSRYHDATDSTSDKATWTFEGLESGHRYQVLTTWTAGGYAASNAPFTIYDNTTPLATELVNQRNTPTDQTVLGTPWQSLGVFTASSTTFKVELTTDDVDGYVVADAIRIVEVPTVTMAPSVVDDGDSAYSQLGSGWTVGTSGNGGDYRSHASGTGSNVAEWTFDALDTTRTYTVYATWVADGDRATDATYALFNDTSSVSTHSVDQTDDPDDITIDGVDWEAIGTIVATSGRAVIKLSDDANGRVIADAIRLVTPGQVLHLAAPSAVMEGQTATVTATVLGEPVTDITAVQFWEDVNNNGVVDSGTDTLIEADTSGVWSTEITSASSGTFHGLVRSALQAGGYGPTATFQIQVNEDYAIVDNGDLGYATHGANWAVGSTLSGYGSDFDRASSLDGTANWTFSGLAAGSYKLYATYQASGGNIHGATYNIYDEAPDGSGDYGSAALRSRALDQTIAPTDYESEVIGSHTVTVEGLDWVYIGTVTISGSEVSVELTNGEGLGGAAVADAVMAVATDELSGTIADVDMHVGQGITDSHVIDLAAAFAGVGSPAGPLSYSVSDTSANFEVASIDDGGATLTLVPKASSVGNTTVVTVTATDGFSFTAAAEFVVRIGDNLIKNGGFEEQQIGTGWTYSRTINNNKDWKVDPTGPSTSPNSNGNIEIQHGILGGAHTGTQHAELDAHPSPGSMRIYQEVSTVPGEYYVLSFWFRARPGTSAGDNILGVMVSSSDAGSAYVNQQYTTSNSSSWQQYTLAFKADSYSTKIYFEDRGTQNTLGTFIDDVALQEVLWFEDGSGSLTVSEGTCIPCLLAQIGQGQAVSPNTPQNPSSPLASGARPDGRIQIAYGSLGSGGFGIPLAQTGSWTNGPQYATGQGGNGTLSQMPRIVRVDDDTLVIVSGTASYFFDLVDDVYVPRDSNQEQLAHDDGSHEFVLTDSTGVTIRFNDFDSSLAPPQQGIFKGFTDNGGNSTTVTGYTPEGRIAEVQRSATQGASTITESYQYQFVSSGPNGGMQQSLTLRRKVDSGAWTTVRKEEYTYYGENEANGNLGDLKLSVVKDGAGSTLDTTYFRYYKPGEAGGYTHGLKYEFGMQSFGRLSGAYDPFTATDGQAAAYADAYMEYDAQGRVVTLVNQGQGCSSCTGGLGTYALEYATSDNADGYNSWKFKTVETLPDDNQNIVYTNYLGQTMLSVFKDTTTDQEWITFTEYDAAGRPILTANPSAVTGYDDGYADLLHNDGGNYQYLADHAGLITITDYYGSTDATDSESGGVAGYYQDTQIQRGESEDPILQQSVDYFSRTAGGVTIYVTAHSTVYRLEGATDPESEGAETTSYAYTWFTDTTQIQSIETSLPAISPEQNGPDVADVSTVVMDQYGRPIWTKDADGFINYTEYDQATGAVVMTIQDVETGAPAYFPTLPDGWATPEDVGGLNLITTYDVDSLGRVTRMTDPNGHTTFTTYNDAAHEARTYVGYTWDPEANDDEGGYVRMDSPPPTQVYREDRLGGYTESLTMSATPNVNAQGRPLGTEAISNLETLSRSYTNEAGQMIASDAYFDFTGLSYSTDPEIGVKDTNYYRTEYAYDHRGRLEKTVDPTGTITRTVYDGLGREVSIWVGTDDVPDELYWSPENNDGADMVKISENIYDNGGVADSNLTRSTDLPDDSGDHNRVTDYFYDWRDRLVATKSGVLLDGSGDPDPTSETDSLHRPIMYMVYDNLSQASDRLVFDGDGVTITTTDGVPDQPDVELLRAKTTTDYDDQGRVFQTSTYSVDQTDGTASTDALISEKFFDHRGRVIKTSSPGGLVQKMQYDGAGRAVKSFVTDGGGDTDWSDAQDGTDDNVLEQTETQYDADGNAILSISKSRFHDETATGQLGDTTTGPLARVSYAAMYYDAANRITDSVNVGTNGGIAYTRPASAPSRSDTVLVTSHGYDDSGWQSSVIDPRAIESRTSYDRLGRTTETIQAYADGDPSAADDLTTQYTYDGMGHTLTLTAVLPGSTHQTTEYVYGVTTAGGSTINSNNLLATVKYPDKTTGDASTSAADQESFAYNALGQTIEKTDRNGSVHDYVFDQLGRGTADIVSVLGSGVDGAIRRAGMNYDTGGRLFQTTSYSDAAGTSVVNQVERHYNGLGQLMAEYQEHSGEVDTGASLVVQYAYSEMAGGANNSRLTSMTYPDGRIVRYEYVGGLDDSISRLSFLADDDDGDVGTHLEEFSYLGLSTVVKAAHPESGVDLTYIKLSPEDSSGDAGDQYTGLDRFGRVVDQHWVNGEGEDIDRSGYGYDEDSNRLYRENLVDAAFSELYHDGGGYDLLNRLTSFSRGELNGGKDSIADPTRSQDWNLDALGNWSDLTNDGGSPEEREHNAQNQVTSVGENELTFDNNGNTTTDEQGRILIYDAWNRLVEVQDDEETPIVDYKYDGLNRRITEDSGTPRELYYSVKWQVVEERESGIAVVQNVWSPVYVDALLLRDRNANATGGDGLNDDGLEERLYAQHDANYNVTALTDTSGDVQERYIYDPYGGVSYLAHDFTPLDPNASTFAWQYLHQGGRLDLITGIYLFRRRDYITTLGRWAQIDPIQYRDGSNMYLTAGDNPTTLVDPMGTEKLFVDIAVSAEDTIPTKFNASNVRVKLQQILDSAYINVRVNVHEGKHPDGDRGFIYQTHCWYSGMWQPSPNMLNPTGWFIIGIFHDIPTVCCRSPIAYNVNVTFVTDPIWAGTVRAVAMSQGPVTRISQEQINVYLDKHPEVNLPDWDFGYANILAHEVFWIGIGGADGGSEGTIANAHYSWLEQPTITASDAKKIASRLGTDISSP